jgi:hypothetical protein
MLGIIKLIEKMSMKAIKLSGVRDYVKRIILLKPFKTLSKVSIYSLLFIGTILFYGCAGSLSFSPLTSIRSITSGEYVATRYIKQIGQCEMTGKSPYKSTVRVEVTGNGFSFEKKEIPSGRTINKIEAHYTSAMTANVSITNFSSCSGVSEIHTATSDAIIQNGVLKINEYVITWCKEMECIFSESWELRPK